MNASLKNDQTPTPNKGGGFWSGVANVLDPGAMARSRERKFSRMINELMVQAATEGKQLEPQQIFEAAQKCNIPPQKALEIVKAFAEFSQKRRLQETSRQPIPGAEGGQTWETGGMLSKMLGQEGAQEVLGMGQKPLPTPQQKGYDARLQALVTKGGAALPSTGLPGRVATPTDPLLAGLAQQGRLQQLPGISEARPQRTYQMPATPFKPSGTRAEFEEFRENPELKREFLAYLKERGAVTGKPDLSLSEKFNDWMGARYEAGLTTTTKDVEGFFRKGGKDLADKFAEFKAVFTEQMGREPTAEEIRKYLIQDPWGILGPAQPTERPDIRSFYE